MVPIRLEPDERGGRGLADLMRLLALTNDSTRCSGGIAQYNRDFIAALCADEKFAVTVLPRVGPATADARSDFHEEKPIKNRAAYSVRAVIRARDGFDIVFCAHLNLAPVARAAALISGARLLFQAHGVEAWNCPSSLIRRCIESADLVLSVSRFTRNRVLSWASIPPERAIVLSNTVHGAFTPGKADALRAAWDLEGKFVLLSVGRMVSHEAYKGQDRVIAALPSLLRRYPNLAYVIVGEGDDTARLRSQAVEAGVSGHVLFKGAMTREQLVDVYRMADLFVMPSTGEGFGIAYLEAMACGTPAFGLACGGAVDPLCDGELGFAAAESEFLPALEAAIAAEPPDPDNLARAVQARFGHHVFDARVRQAVSRCGESNGYRH